MNMKNIATAFIMVLAVLVLSTVAFADNGVNVSYVKIDGEVYEDGESLRVELGDELNIKVKLTADTNVSDVEVSARLVGYEHADKASAKTFDLEIVDEMQDNDVEYVTLNLDVPTELDKDGYNLRVFVLGQDVDFVFKSDIRLNVVGEDNRVDVVRVSFDPAQVVAGRALRTRVKLDNIGEEDEDDVFVQVAIPELGPSMVVSADIDELDEDEKLTSEDLLLRIPACTPAGTYDVEVTVEFDDGYESTTVVEEITVLESESCGATSSDDNGPASGRTVITPPQNQDIVAGASGVSFPVVISNEGNTVNTYTVTVSGVSGWGTVEVTNPAPLVRAGDNEVVYVYVAANKDAEGKQVFEIEVSDGDDSRSIPVVANVVKDGSSWDLKNVLYVAVIVLLILVIILGLVIGLNKSKDNEKEYY